MGRNRISEETKEAIRAYNKTIVSGNSKERYAKIRLKFGFCFDVISSIVRNGEGGRRVRCKKPLTNDQKKLVKDLYDSITSTGNHNSKVTIISKQLNKSASLINEFIKGKDSKRMFNHKHPFHGFI